MEILVCIQIIRNGSMWINPCLLLRFQHLVTVAWNSRQSICLVRSKAAMMPWITFRSSCGIGLSGVHLFDSNAFAFCSQRSYPTRWHSAVLPEMRVHNLDNTQSASVLVHVCKTPRQRRSQPVNVSFSSWSDYLLIVRFHRLGDLTAHLLQAAGFFSIILNGCRGCKFQG